MLVFFSCICHLCYLCWCLFSFLFYFFLFPWSCPASLPPFVIAFISITCAFLCVQACDSFPSLLREPEFSVFADLADFCLKYWNFFVLVYFWICLSWTIVGFDPCSAKLRVSFLKFDLSTAPNLRCLWCLRLDPKIPLCPSDPGAVTKLKTQKNLFYRSKAVVRDMADQSF